MAGKPETGRRGAARGAAPRDDEIAALRAALADKDRALVDCLEHQKATSDILRAITSSPGEAKAVLGTIVETSQRLFGSWNATITQIADGVFHEVISVGPNTDSVVKGLTGRPVGPDTVAGRAVREQRIVQVTDVGDSGLNLRSGGEAGPTRTVACAPLICEGESIGTLAVVRPEARPFAESELALLQSFADQAVIAIENARLLTELRESLERQTAMAEVLQVISSSPGELQPVFDSMLDHGLRLCEASVGVLLRSEGDGFRPAAHRGHSEAMGSAIAEMGGLLRPGPSAPLTEMMRTRETVQVADLAATPAYRDGDASVVVAVERSKIRTSLLVPILKDRDVIGAFVIHRLEVRPFGEKQISLLESFADQAVIAIENTRLLAELRESLDRRTAIAEVLQVISSSPGKLQPVFETMLQSAVRLCEASNGSVFRVEGDLFRRVTSVNLPPELAAQTELRFSPEFPASRMLASKSTVRITDAMSELAERPDHPTLRMAAERTGARSALWVPMVKDGEVVAAFVLSRGEVRAFTDSQIVLVENFAQQAVIAIENARLLDELNSRNRDLGESLEQQTASAEILRAIASSPGEAATVLDTIAGTAMRTFGATNVGIRRIEDNVVRLVGSAGFGLEEMKHEHRDRPLDRTAYVGLCAVQNRQIHIPDLTNPPEGLLEGARMPEITRLSIRSGNRTVAFTPLAREGQVIGVMAVNRSEVRPFTDKELALMTGFADQAVIAIENDRLLHELRAARDAAERNLVELRAAQANLIQAEKMASLGQLTAGIAHEIKNPLNFVNNFAGLSVELLDELKVAQAAAVDTLDAGKRAEIDEIIATITGNLQKVAEHGRRADGIVKSMLAHSRGGSGERQDVNLNALINEALNLAYHGARAQDQSFNVTLERDLDSALGPIEVVPQDLTRVFLNLFGNGFYAASKRGKDEDRPDFRPTLKVSTRDLGSEVTIRIRDNGTGIPPEVRSRLFQPFFTTKPTGEGTGLGLSISYEIITHQHGGTIEVDSEPGHFTEFIVTVPKRFRATGTSSRTHGETNA